MGKYTELYTKQWITAVNKMGAWVVIDCDATTKFVDYGPTTEERDHFYIEIRLGDPDELESLANTVCALLNASNVTP